MPARGAAASDNVAQYVARAAPGEAIVLDVEHDGFEWLSLDDALERCLPAVVAEGLANAAAWLDARRTSMAARHTIGTKSAHSSAKIPASVRSGERTPQRGTPRARTGADAAACARPNLPTTQRV